MEHKRANQISPASAWALSFGCIIGFGCFVMPGDSVLPKAGPLGTAIATVIGALVMCLIAANFSRVIRYMPTANGPYTYTSACFGRTHAFVCAWFLALSYVAIVPMNATALALVCGKLFGNVLQVGPHYVVAGFDVYLVEVLLAEVALSICSFIHVRMPNSVIRLQLMLVMGLVLSMLALLVGITLRHGAQVWVAQPAFSPERSPLAGVVSVAALLPWAFVGFDVLSLTVFEHTFEHKRLFPIMVSTIAAGALVYIALADLAAVGYPQGYASWYAYIKVFKQMPGIDSLPTFRAAWQLLGAPGLTVIGVAAFCAVATAILGFFHATVRLVQAMAEDRSLPLGLAGRSHTYGTPAHAINLVVAISMAVPFLGRTALGWVVDMSSVGIAVAYAYTSACVYRCARVRGDILGMVLGVVGTGVSLVFMALLLVPLPGLDCCLGREAYICLITWIALGVNFYTPGVAKSVSSANA